ncbi:MAG TPA: hypothetical protein VKJ45_10610 [Blastocatellia bacterium]|nr:hypothetical protein [Blastocatellia bacterium]
MAETAEIAAKKRALEIEDEEKPFERSAEAIRQDIAAHRDSIADTVDRLGERIQGSLDWRRQVGNHPIGALACAAAAGLLVSSLFRRRSSPTERILDAVAEVVEDVTGQARHRIAALVGPGAARGLVKTAAGALAARAVADLLAQRSNLAERAGSRNQRASRM